MSLTCRLYLRIINALSEKFKIASLYIGIQISEKQAHNLKVTGSNPVPATKPFKTLSRSPPADPRRPVKLKSAWPRP